MKINWKITLGLLVAALIILIAAFSAQISKSFNKVEAYYAHQFHQSVATGLSRGFKKVAQKINRRGPVMQSKYVRLDKASAGPGARITYFYTLVKHPARDFDRTRLSASLKRTLVGTMCNNDKIKPSIFLGATYIYVYRGNDGIEVSRVQVNQQICDALPVQTAKP